MGIKGGCLQFIVWVYLPKQVKSLLHTGLFRAFSIQISCQHLPMEAVYQIHEMTKGFDKGKGRRADRLRQMSIQDGVNL